MEEFDVVIVGAGMAGASLAWALAPKRRVLLLEQESQPGYHSTGRSAATLHSSYGNATVRALTAASAPFYREPPPGFAADRPRPPAGRAHASPARTSSTCSSRRPSTPARFVPQHRALGRGRGASPGCRPCAASRSPPPCYDPTMLDLDVAAIHAGFLRGARAAGATLRTDAGLVGAAAVGGGWRLRAARRRDRLRRPGQRRRRLGRHGGRQLPASARSGIVPKRRTAIIVQAPPGSAVESWPMIGDVAEEWYVKPDAGRLLCSPADETPSEPCDAQPDELDVAICVDRIETAFDFPIRRIESRWAGLRCFAADKTPVAGFDPRASGFFWLAGQGGYGIQTAPALAMLSAALICGEPVPERLRAASLALDPSRLLRPLEGYSSCGSAGWAGSSSRCRCTTK